MPIGAEVVAVEPGPVEDRHEEDERVEEHQPADPGDDGERHLLGGLDDPGDVEQQRDDEHAQRRQHRGTDDALRLSVEHRRDRAEAEPLADGVEQPEQRGAARLDGDGDAEQERAEAGQPEAAGDRDGGVGVAAAEIDGDGLDRRGPPPRPAGHQHGQQDEGLDADAGDRHRTRRRHAELRVDELVAEGRVARTKSGARCSCGVCHGPPGPLCSGRARAVVRPGRDQPQVVAVVSAGVPAVQTAVLTAAALA